MIRVELKTPEAGVIMKKYRQRLSHSIAVFALLLAGGHCNRDKSDKASSEKPKTEMEALLQRIEEMRAEARYADAAGLARKLKDIQDASQSPSWQSAQTLELLDILQRCSELSQADQKAMSEADAAMARTKKLIHDAKFDNAIELVKKSQEIYRRLLGETSDQVVECLQQLAALHAEKCELGVAEQLVRESISITSTNPAQQNDRKARSLGLLGLVLVRLDKLNEAESVLNEAIAIQREVLPEEHDDMADILQHLAQLRMAQARDSQAEALLHEVVRIRTVIHGRGHESVALALRALAETLVKRGSARQAEAYLLEALPIMERAYRANHPYTADVLAYLGRAQTELNSFSDAEKSLRKALEMFRMDGTDQTLLAAKAMNGLATLLQVQGKYTEANTLLLKSLEIQKQLLGSQSSAVAEALDELGELRSTQRRYAEAESLYREALAIFEAISWGDSFNAAVTLQNLGVVVRFKGSFFEAERMFEQVLQKHRKLGTDQYVEANVTLNNLAHVKIANREYDSAQRLLEEVIRYRRQKFGPQSPSLANSIFNLAELARNREHYQEAARLHREALEMRRKILGDSHPDVAGSRSVLGRVEAALGRANEAIDSQRNVLEQRRRELGPDHQDVGDSSFYLGHALYINGEPEEAIPYLEESLRIAELLRTKIPGDERQRAEYSYVLYLPRIASLLTQAYLQTNRPEKAIDSFERGRARAFLDLLIAAQPETSIQASSPNESAADRSPFFRTLLPDAKPATWNEIREVLRSGEVMVFYNWSWDCMSVITASASTNVMESALLADSEKSTKELTDSLQKIADTCAQRSALNAGEIARLANRAVPEKIRAQILSADRVILVANGPLRSLPMEALLWESEAKKQVGGSTLLPPISYVDSGTVFLNRRHAGQQESQAADHEPTFQAALLGNARLGETAPDATLPVRTLGSLPGAERECRAIEEVIRQAGGSATVLVGERATLVNLESAAKGVDILHLATHGLLGTPQDPFNARLALAPDSDVAGNDDAFLTLDWIIRKWRGLLRSSKLVVLSGCDTHKGTMKADNTLALPWGFMYAGAPTVIASLWKVDDAATTLLMDRFYKNLLKPQERGAKPNFAHKDRALSEAKQWLKNLNPAEAKKLLVEIGLPDEFCQSDGNDKHRAGIVKEPAGPQMQNAAPCDFSHPYYWAAFVLIGEPD